MLFLILLVMGGFILGINVLPITKNFKVTYAIKFVNQQGYALSNVTIVNWNYGYSPIVRSTNSSGEVTFIQEQQWTTSLFLSKWKWAAPNLYPVRLYFPKHSPYYFRLEASRKSLEYYHVFNSTYDYFLNENWLGKFNCNSNANQEIDSTFSINVCDYNWYKKSKDEINISFVIQPEFVH